MNKDSNRALSLESSMRPLIEEVISGLGRYVNTHLKIAQQAVGGGRSAGAKDAP